MPSKDPAKRAACNRAYYESHRAERQAHDRAYKQRPEVKARQAAYWQRPEVKAARRAYQRDCMRIGDGRTVHINSLPPEMKEVALLLRHARQLIRNPVKGTQL